MNMLLRQDCQIVGRVILYASVCSDYIFIRLEIYVMLYWKFPFVMG